MIPTNENSFTADIESYKHTFRWYVVQNKMGLINTFIQPFLACLFLQNFSFWHVKSSRKIFITCTGILDEYMYVQRFLPKVLIQTFRDMQ